MHFLDMRTIVFTMLITGCICALLMFLLWRQNRTRYAGISFWALDFTFQSIALFLVVLRGSIPDWMSIVLSNTMVLTGTLLGYIGLESFTNRKSRQVHNYILIGLFALLHSYFGLIQPDLAVRNLNLSIAWLIIFLQCFWLMVGRVNRAMRSVTFGVGIVYGAFCLLNLVRITQYLANRSLEQDWFRSGTFEAVVLLGYNLLLILLTYNLVLMVNKRLLAEVEQEEEKFSKAFHSSPYGVVLIRMSDEIILEVNEGFQNITGYLSSEIAGKTTTDLNIWTNTDDRAVFIDEVSNKGKIHDIELALRKKTGEILTAIISAEVILINNQKTLLCTINDITGRKLAEAEREKLIRELREALSQIKTLGGLLPICASCKKIRNDKGYWEHIEQYIKDHSEADFSHGICPECEKKLYPEFHKKR